MPDTLIVWHSWHYWLCKVPLAVTFSW